LSAENIQESSRTERKVRKGYLEEKLFLFEGKRNQRLPYPWLLSTTEAKHSKKC
jgi:hypothetical protein